MLGYTNGQTKVNVSIAPRDIPNTWIILLLAVFIMSRTKCFPSTRLVYCFEICAVYTIQNCVSKEAKNPSAGKVNKNRTPAKTNNNAFDYYYWCNDRSKSRSCYGKELPGSIPGSHVLTLWRTRLSCLLSVPVKSRLKPEENKRDLKQQFLLWQVSKNS